MDCDSSEIVAHQFAFPGMKSGTELETQRASIQPPFSLVP